MADSRGFCFIDNYIYLEHLNKFFVLPCEPESITDSMGAHFSSSQPLGRSAPTWSYTGSGPRTVQVSFTLHRDMMNNVNASTSNLKLTNFEGYANDDYIDCLIKGLQAAVMPNYDAATKAVNPPIVAMRLGDIVFIRGIINGDISVTYKLPKLRNEKYAVVELGITITEIDAYGADQVYDVGSFRGLSTTLNRKAQK